MSFFGELRLPIFLLYPSAFHLPIFATYLTLRDISQNP